MSPVTTEQIKSLKKTPLKSQGQPEHSNLLLQKMRSEITSQSSKRKKKKWKGLQMQTFKKESLNSANINSIVTMVAERSQ